MRKTEQIKEILANNQALIEKGIEFYFPINPKEI